MDFTVATVLELRVGVVTQLAQPRDDERLGVGLELLGDTRYELVGVLLEGGPEDPADLVKYTSLGCEDEMLHLHRIVTEPLDKHQGRSQSAVVKEEELVVGNDLGGTTVGGSRLVLVEAQHEHGLRRRRRGRLDSLPLGFKELNVLLGLGHRVPLPGRGPLHDIGGDEESDDSVADVRKVGIAPEFVPRHLLVPFDLGPDDVVDDVFDGLVEIVVGDVT